LPDLTLSTATEPFAMPEFILDASGKAYVSISDTTLEARYWTDLDAFTQGYIEALFFTENEPGTTREDRMTARGTVRKSWETGAREGHHHDMPGDYGFADLAAETLASILADCAKFQQSNAWNTYVAHLDAISVEDDSPYQDETDAGRDFWYTRNGHGCGFWDGDWPEPYATELDKAAKAFSNVDVYLGDDGRVYL
jgi:hypothetical protein